MKTIAVAMAKGGVGKTTTAVNLAYGLASQGKKTLLVDTDTQNQVTAFLGIKPEHGLYEFVIGEDGDGNEISRMEALYPARKNLWVLCGGLKLVRLKNWLGEQDQDKRQTILAERLSPKEGMLDFIIYDCAPGWDILSVNILYATEEILCPVALQGPAVEGLKTYLQYIRSAQELNPDLTLKYILPTLFDQRTRQSHEILEQLKNTFGDKVLDPIRLNVRLSEAPSHGQTIFEYSKAAAGAVDYKKLIKRIKKDAAS